MLKKLIAEDLIKSMKEKNQKEPLYLEKLLHLLEVKEDICFRNSCVKYGYYYRYFITVLR